METELTDKELKRSRVMYIIEATLEYFVSIGVGGFYLAKIAHYIGLQDDVIGILSSFVTLGCSFQIISIFISNNKPVKTWVTAGHIISQLFFSALYFIPLLSSGLSLTKQILFVIVLLCAQIIHNVINSPKINWFMSLIDDKKRGRFTAVKEIVSLAGGMLFSFGIGRIVDVLEAKGSTELAFLVLGIIMLVLTVLHTLTLLFSKEKKKTSVTKFSIKEEFILILKDKTLLKVILISVFWNCAHCVTTSFMGTYLNNELAFTATLVSITTIVGSIFRILFSIPFGKFADKYSFSKLLVICFSIEAIAFVFAMFTTPANGKVFYLIYHVLYCIGMAGINSSTINLIYDFIVPERRVSTLAIKQTFAGLTGFFVTLAVSPLLKKIQANGNRFLGLNVYAQQVFACASAIMCGLLVLYIIFVIVKNDKKARQ